MKFDDILDNVGEFGLYQKYVVSLLFLPCLFAALQALAYVFASADPKHRCYVKGCDSDNSSYVDFFVNSTVPWDSKLGLYSECNVYSAITNTTNITTNTCPAYEVNLNSTESCSRWKYDDSIYESTTVTQWDLVCGDDFLVAMPQSAYMIGVMIGSIIFGLIADRFGRKVSLLISLAVGLITTTASIYVPYYSFFLVLKVVVGACYQGVYMTSFIMSVEMVGKSKRALCGMLASIFYSIGEILLGVTAFYVRDWQTLQLIISVPGVIFLSYFWLVPESPRWMIAKNQNARARKVLERIARSNQKTVPYDLLNADTNDIIVSAGEPSLEKTDGSSVKKSTLLDLFQTPRMRWRSINVFFNWFVITISYYGITMSAPSLGGNEFWNFVIISAVEIPSYIFGILVLDRWGRRLPLCGCMIIGGIAGTCTAFVPTTPEFAWLSITLAVIGKFGAAAAFGIIYVFSAEIFPTVVRNNGLGVSSMIGHIGGVIAPYIAKLNSINAALPLVIFGICCLVAGVAAITLPETLGHQLPETVEDAENFGSSHRQVLQVTSGPCFIVFLLKLFVNHDPQFVCAIPMHYSSVKSNEG